MASVDVQLKKDISTLPQQSLDQVAKDFFKDPDSGGHRFSAKLLDDPNSGFVLTGVVNRMDRAYRVVDGFPKLPTCGEIRFLYRFTYDVTVDGRKVASRLPFTMSVVLNARQHNTTLSCVEIAKRWAKLRTISDKAALIKYLDSGDGPLIYLDPSQVDRVEMNLQLFRVPAGVKTDFGGDAEYLLRVFRRDRPGGPFVPTRLENQIDRDDLLAHPQRLAAFKKWLFSRAAMMDLDRGILDIPFAFLANRATSVSPGGADPQRKPAVLWSCLRRGDPIRARRIQCVGCAACYDKVERGIQTTHKRYELQWLSSDASDSRLPLYGSGSGDRAACERRARSGLGAFPRRHATPLCDNCELCRRKAS